MLLVFPYQAVQIFAGLVQHLEDTLRTGDSGLQLSIDLGDFIDRTAELFGIHDEGGDNAHGNHAVDGKVAAESGDNDKTDVADAVHDRPHNTAANFGADTCFCEPVGNVAEFFRGLLLPVIGHHGAVTVDDFFHCAVHTAQQGLPFFGVFTDKGR